MNYDMFKTTIWPSLNKLLYDRGICSCDLYLSRTTPNTCFVGITKLSDDFQIEGPSYTYGDLRQVSVLSNLHETFMKLDKRVQEVMKEALESFNVSYTVRNECSINRMFAFSSYVVDLTKLD